MVVFKNIRSVAAPRRPGVRFTVTRSTPRRRAAEFGWLSSRTVRSVAAPRRPGVAICGQTFNAEAPGRRVRMTFFKNVRSVAASRRPGVRFCGHTFNAEAPGRRVRMVVFKNIRSVAAPRRPGVRFSRSDVQRRGAGPPSSDGCLQEHSIRRGAPATRRSICGQTFNAEAPGRRVRMVVFKNIRSVAAPRRPGVRFAVRRSTPRRRAAEFGWLSLRKFDACRDDPALKRGVFHRAR